MTFSLTFKSLSAHCFFGCHCGQNTIPGAHDPPFAPPLAAQFSRRGFPSGVLEADAEGVEAEIDDVPDEVRLVSEREF
jgi:hypothetical protein